MCECRNPEVARAARYLPLTVLPSAMMTADCERAVRLPLTVTSPPKSRTAPRPTFTSPLMVAPGLNAQFSPFGTVTLASIVPLMSVVQITLAPAEATDEEDSIAPQGQCGYGSFSFFSSGDLPVQGAQSASAVRARSRPDPAAVERNSHSANGRVGSRFADEVSACDGTGEYPCPHLKAVRSVGSGGQVGVVARAEDGGGGKAEARGGLASV